MRKGTVIVAGQACCKVRFMINDQLKRVDKATPSTPVQVSGWKEMPLPGDLILEVPSEVRFLIYTISLKTSHLFVFKYTVLFKLGFRNVLTKLFTIE